MSLQLSGNRCLVVIGKWLKQQAQQANLIRDNPTNQDYSLLAVFAILQAFLRSLYQRLREEKTPSHPTLSKPVHCGVVVSHSVQCDLVEPYSAASRPSVDVKWTR